MSDILSPDSRKRFTDDLAELLTCLLCCETVEGELHMCVRAHPLCTLCRDVCRAVKGEFHDRCPTCHSEFSKYRNFGVEELHSKLREVQSTLLGREAPTTPATASSSSSSTATVPEPQQSGKSALVSPTMIYCWILRCRERLPVDDMLQHIRTNHAGNLSNVVLIGRLYQRWQVVIHVDYVKYNVDDYAFYVEGMGLFGLSAHVDGDENVEVQLTSVEPVMYRIFHTVIIEIDDEGIRKFGLVNNYFSATKLPKFPRPLVFDNSLFQGCNDQSKLKIKVILRPH